MIRRSLATALLIAAAFLMTAACGTTPMSTRTIEERYMGMGEANRMMVYGQTLLDHGRYREAMAAFNGAEQAAYTGELRRAARQRRMWLEEVLYAMERGRDPFPSPNDFVRNRDGLFEPPDPRKFQEAPLKK